MVRVTLALTLVSAGVSFAFPRLFHRQEQNSLVGQGNGQQFITGECASAADCASGCCVDQGDSTAQCKARIPTEESGASCDFGGAGAAGGEGGEEVPGGEDAATDSAGVDDGAGAANGTDTDKGTIDDGAGSANGTDTENGAVDAGGACGAVAEGDGSASVGLGDGSQFITGQCFSPADCASGCCADQGDGTARCGARFPTENERGQTCDFTCSAA